MICNDEPIRYLKDLGYNVARLPKADILPLQVFVKKGTALEPLGDIQSVLTAGPNIALPVIKKNIRMSNITGGKTGGINIKPGLDILGNIVEAMGGRKTGLDLQYGHAHTISFQFQDVLGDAIEIAVLDKYLNDATINPHSRQLKRYLEDDKIYIITSTIKTNKLSIEAWSKNRTALEIDVSAISKVVGSQIGVDHEQGKTTAVDFNGKTRLVFGFKAIRLIYKDGRYTAFETVKDGGIAALAEKAALGSDPDERHTQILVTVNSLVDFLDAVDL